MLISMITTNADSIPVQKLKFLDQRTSQFSLLSSANTPPLALLDFHFKKSVTSLSPILDATRPQIHVAISPKHSRFGSFLVCCLAFLFYAAQLNLSSDSLPVYYRSTDLNRLSAFFTFFFFFTQISLSLSSPCSCQQLCRSSNYILLLLLQTAKSSLLSYFLQFLNAFPMNSAPHIKVS